jgi:hypothetical protein
MLTIENIRTTAEVRCAALYPAYAVEVKPTASGAWLVVSDGYEHKVAVLAPKNEAEVCRQLDALVAEFRAKGER